MLTEERREGIKKAVIDHIMTHGQTCLTVRETCLSYMVGYCPEVTLREAGGIINEIVREVMERKRTA